MQKVLKSKMLIGIVLAMMAAAAVVVIAVNGSHSGNDLQSQLDLGRKYVSELDYENAIIAYEKVLEIDPYCTEAYFELSEAYLALGQQDKAIEIMEQARNMLSDNVEVYVYLTQLYASQNRMDLVIATLESGIQATNSDRLKDMLREYQLAQEQTEPENGELIAKAAEKEEREPETTETSSDIQEEQDEERPSITIGLRQSEQRQDVEPVLIVDRDNEELVVVPLITPPSLPEIVNDDNANREIQNNERNQYNDTDNRSENNGGNQDSSSDNGSESNGGNQDSSSDDNLGSIGGNQGSDSDNSTDTEEPNIPQTGIIGNVYGIDGQGIDGVTIHIYSDQTETPIAANTDTIGQYIQDLSAGIYHIVLSKDGYVDLSTSISVLDNILTSNSYIMLTTEESRQAASLKGIVVNATNSQNIEGATVTLLSGFDKTSSDAPDESDDSIHAVTESDGSFSIDEGVNAGYYTIETSKDGYSTYHRNETIRPGENEITINMSPEIVVQGIYRIVLTWGETPRDLDSHLICTGDDNYHVYYADKKSDDGMAELDWDDTTSYGPETITVQIEAGNSYIYAVHNFTNGGASAGSNEAWNLANSGANVAVYDDTGIIFDGNVPVYEQGITWEVFRIENGRLIVTNNVSFDYPSNLTNNETAIVSNNANDDIPMALSSSEDKETEENTASTESESTADSEEDSSPEETTIPSETIEPTESEESEESKETPETEDTDLEEAETVSETTVETEEEEETAESAEPEASESTAESEQAAIPSESADSSDTKESDELSETSSNTADSDQYAENNESVEETNEQ